jgi:dipeptidase D
MGILEGLKPEGVWQYFEELEQIPRGSGNTAAVADWLVDFARERDYEYSRDDYGNVVIYGPASEGYEDSEPVILQGHMDMVPQKTADSDHDFAKDPISLMIDGDFITADGTTLGGDDGIAVAFMLALLDDDTYAHPPLECVFTTDEEVGLLGADAFDCSKLKGRRMINMDSEDEGIFTCGCAGGCRVECTLPIKRTSQKGLPVLLEISGLKGGHSGQLIDKYRANADKLLGRFLYALGADVAFSLVSVAGGDKDNAIPNAAKAQILIDEEDYPLLVTFAEKYNADLISEFKGIDEEISLKTIKGSVHKVEVMVPESTDKVIFMIMHSPYGVRKMSGQVEGLVETSSNLGILRTGEKEFACISSIRSSVYPARKALMDEYESLTQMLGGQIRFIGEYPAWEYNSESPLRDTMVESYKNLFGKDPVVNVIHAGLECGLFYERIPGLDAVSIGPDLADIHTFNEKLSISSAQRTWDFLLRVLSALK